MINSINRDTADVEQEMSKWLPKLHSVVIGPGLGRDENLLNKTAKIINMIETLNRPMVIDAVRIENIKSIYNDFYLICNYFFIEKGWCALHFEQSKCCI